MNPNLLALISITLAVGCGYLVGLFKGGKEAFVKVKIYCKACSNGQLGLTENFEAEQVRSSAYDDVDAYCDVELTKI